MGMNARSTNTKGFVHYGGDVVAGIEDGIAVHLRSASTGSAAVIEPLSDSSTGALTVRAKGAATLTLGNSSNAVSLLGSGVTVGAGSAVKGIYSTTFAYAFTALSSGATVESNISTATGDITTGDLISIELGLPAVSTHTISYLGFRTSTAAASRVVVILGNIASTAIPATGSGTGRITWIDLT